MLLLPLCRVLCLFTPRSNGYKDIILLALALSDNRSLRKLFSRRQDWTAESPTDGNNKKTLSLTIVKELYSYPNCQLLLSTLSIQSRVMTCQLYELWICYSGKVRWNRLLFPYMPQCRVLHGDPPAASLHASRQAHPLLPSLARAKHIDYFLPVLPCLFLSIHCPSLFCRPGGFRRLDTAIALSRLGPTAAQCLLCYFMGYGAEILLSRCHALFHVASQTRKVA